MSNINETGVNTIVKTKKEKTLDGIYKVVHQVYSQSENGWVKSKPIFNVKTKRNDSGDIKPLTFECGVANDYGLHLFLEHNLVKEKTEIEIVDGKPKKVSYIKWIANRPSDDMYLMMWNTIHQKKKEWKPKIKNVPEVPIVTEVSLEPETIIPSNSDIDNVVNKIVNYNDYSDDTDYSKLSKLDISVETLKELKFNNFLLQKVLLTQIEAKQMIKDAGLA